MNSIKIEKLSFSYDDKKILQNINFHIESGEFLCLLGKSGSGKSTLLRIISGLLKPNEGTIYIGKKEHTKPNLKVNMLFQDYSLFPWLTNGENIILAMKQKYKDLSKKEINEIILGYMEKVGLEKEVFNKYPNELSGGMKQRVAICRAFAINPDVLLMDEPFGALDAITRNILQDLTLNMWQGDIKNRKTIVFVTHDVEEALKLGTSIFVMSAKNGDIIYKYEKSKNSDMSINEIRNELIGIMNNDIYQ